MNRTYTREEFFDLVAEARSYMPNVNLSTDIIVGFCSETPEEFEETLDVVRRVQFDTAFMFKYSERPNTLASARFKDDVDADEKTRRITELVALQTEITLQKNSALIGQTHEILVESPRKNKKNEPGWVGRTDGGVLVIIPEGDYQQGQYVNVTISAASPHSLRGLPELPPTSLQEGEQ
jgi:tRNA-2-methylthio-N6-dimethylallyladenosine synthase